MRIKLLICFVFLIGIALGFFLGKPSPVYAQGRVLHVTSFTAGQSGSISGQIVGFSCSGSVCYVAYQ